MLHHCINFLYRRVLLIYVNRMGDAPAVSRLIQKTDTYSH